MGKLYNAIRICRTNFLKEKLCVMNQETLDLKEDLNLNKEIETDLENMQLRIEISKLLLMERYDLAQNKLEHLKKNIYQKRGFNYQYILFTEAIIQHSQYKISDSTYHNALLRALFLSRPSYKANKRIKGILTQQETLILISIAISYKQQGNEVIARKILYQLEEYYKKNMVNFEQNTAELVWYHLSHLLNELGEYDEGQRVAEEGKDLILKYIKEKYKKDLFYLDDISGLMKCMVKKHKLVRS